MVIKECNTDELKERMQEDPNALFYQVYRATVFVKGVKNAGASKNRVPLQKIWLCCNRTQKNLH
jgi:hypothetical protein